jgi:DNA-binding NarL/FixJ family response regulator
MNNTASTPSTDPELTRREREILLMIAKGCTNKEVAAALHIAGGTVQVHVHSILHKLAAENRPQAVAAARRLGLIDDNEERPSAS